MKKKNLTLFFADELRKRTLDEHQSAAMQKFLFPQDISGDEFSNKYAQWEKAHPEHVKTMTEAELDEIAELM